MRRGPLIILSGPSGAGKSTVIRRLLQRFPNKLRLSVSATTRPKRQGEQEGVDYYFWDRDRFEAEVARGSFLEWAEVHGNLYGTPRSEVDRFRDQGIGVILDIDVQGADQVRAHGDDHVSLFLRTSSLQVLEERLRGRGTEREESIQRRLKNARAELTRADSYHHQVVNDDLETAVADLSDIVAPLLSQGD